MQAKSVLITGCSPGGIGHAMAREFHKRGLHVIATARNPAVLADLAALGLSTLQLDVTDPDSLRICHEAVARLTAGKLDILVNNAGRTHVQPAIDVDLDDLRQTFETNVFGVVATVKTFADQLMAARGLIINIASASAVAPYVFGASYAASKGAVVSYSRVLRLELEPYGVRVMVAMTGTVRSQIASRPFRDLPPGSVYEPARHIIAWRFTFSQKTATMETDEYARGLVAAALRPEVPRLLRTWFGRPDWLWTGGMSRVLWLGHSIGEWFVDMICYRMFRMKELQGLLQQQAATKKLT